ncbi:SIR2 family protein [Acinetobacter baumannii]|nr:SIR2 family protein [Acinetobacter baumannii]
MLNEAFYHFSDVRPHVCAHDSSIGSLSVLSDRPKIIKLHGDYLFDDIKNTLKETESLENNTREKFIEFSKDYGLIIVGYSGQDRSIMDVLNYLVQQEEYLKNGVYWCFREDDEISHEVRKILWKDKVYCVKIDGFDQLFAELNNELGINLKQFSEKNSLKIDKCIENFIKDDFNLSSNDYIRKDLLKLKEKSNNQDISELIAKLNESNQNNNLSSIEFKQILEIQNLILTGSFNKTVAKIDKLLQDSGCDLSSELTKFQENLFFMKIDCLEKEKRSSRPMKQLIV